jgi:3-oxoacyl-[acyl-carrier protein] reductase
MDLGLKGKRAFVLGSSRGLGFATALLLAEEGVSVAINGRDQEKLARAREKIHQQTGGQVIALQGDVSDPRTPAELVEKCVAALGGLDILITNSGGPKPGSFENLADTDWMRAVDLCLMAHVRLIRAALPVLKQSASASILTITSISVKQPIPSLILSNSVRAATIGLTKSLALELGNDGIRVNSILPAATETERITDLLKSRAEANGTTIEEEMMKTAQESSLGRIATPVEFAKAAVFLVSPAASYLTGVMLPVDGGSYKGTI